MSNAAQEDEHDDRGGDEEAEPRVLAQRGTRLGETKNDETGSERREAEGFGPGALHRAHAGGNEREHDDERA